MKNIFVETGYSSEQGNYLQYKGGTTIFGLEYALTPRLGITLYW